MADRNMKRCSMSLIREMQIKTTMRYLLDHSHSNRYEITSAGEMCRNKESLYTVGRNENWYSHYGKHYGDFSKD